MPLSRYFVSCLPPPLSPINSHALLLSPTPFSPCPPTANDCRHLTPLLRAHPLQMTATASSLPLSQTCDYCCIASLLSAHCRLEIIMPENNSKARAFEHNSKETMRGARKKPHLLKIKRPVFYTRGVARCEDTMSSDLEQQREHSRIMLNVLLCCSTIIVIL